MQVTRENEQGARIASTPTLFYLAHCEAELCCALLEANAAAGTLHNVAILGANVHVYWLHPRWRSACAANTKSDALFLVRKLPHARSSCMHEVMAKALCAGAFGQHLNLAICCNLEITSITVQKQNQQMKAIK